MRARMRTRGTVRKRKWYQDRTTERNVKFLLATTACAVTATSRKYISRVYGTAPSPSKFAVFAPLEHNPEINPAFHSRQVWFTILQLNIASARGIVAYHCIIQSVDSQKQEEIRQALANIPYSRERGPMGGAPYIAPGKFSSPRSLFE
jgi:hypothetical protein